ncbi:MAG: hypothetical protein H7A37_09350 [Chlamydiales bacterium]|nr:hypothetical protein [Chlamydiia bacterium]MCP5508482.1 hypothetical protein [Chlamydiales bacterium]
MNETGSLRSHISCLFSRLYNREKSSSTLAKKLTEEQEKTRAIWMKRLSSGILPNLTPEDRDNLAFRLAENNAEHDQNDTVFFRAATINGWDTDKIYNLITSGTYKKIIDHLRSKTSYPMNEDIQRETTEEAIKAIEYSTNAEDLEYRLRFGPEFSIQQLLADHPINDQTSWEKHIVRIEGWAVNLLYCKTNKEQKQYGQLMEQSIQMAKDAFERYRLSLDDLLDFLAIRRRLIAQTLNSYKYEYFGEKRVCNYFSPLHYNYIHLHEHVIKLLNQPTVSNNDHIEIEAVKWLASKFTIFRRLPYFEKEPKSITFYGCIDGDRIQLDEVVVFMEKTVNNSYEHNATLFYNEKLNSTACLIHTKPENIPKIMRHCEKLHDSLTVSDHERKIQILGEIFWWICRAKPWERGDPSIAETYFKTLGLFNGILFPAWKEGLIPWEEVIKEPSVDKFGKNFPNLFDEPIRFSLN